MSARRSPISLHLIGALCAGEVSLDKVRTVADVATPESDQELCEEAQRCSVRELARRGPSSRVKDPRSSSLTSAEQHGRRFVRFNDKFRTVDGPAAIRGICRDQGVPRSPGQGHPVGGGDSLGPPAL